MSMLAEKIITDEQVKQFHDDGYLIVRGLFSIEETVSLRDHFMAIHAAGPIEGFFNPVPLEQTGGDLLRHYPRIVHPHRWDEMSKRYMLDARIESTMRDLFGEDPLAAQSMHYFKPPGARGQALHQDNFYLRVSPGTCIASWMALDNADRENGGLFVVPGSHRLDVLCPHPSDLSQSFTIEEVDVPEGMQPVPADLEAGDVLFFNGSMIHGSWPNSSRHRFRRSFICHYVGRSTSEMAHGYSPLLSFAGEPVTVDAAQGGGPCGTEELVAFERAKATHRKECETGILQGAIAP